MFWLELAVLGLALLILGTVFLIGSAVQIARLEARGVRFSCQKHLKNVENGC